jgi:hypothetical protein
LRHQHRGDPPSSHTLGIEETEPREVVMAPQRAALQDLARTSVSWRVDLADGGQGSEVERTGIEPVTSGLQSRKG